MISNSKVYQVLQKNYCAKTNETSHSNIEMSYDLSKFAMMALHDLTYGGMRHRQLNLRCARFMSTQKPLKNIGLITLIKVSGQCAVKVQNR